MRKVDRKTIKILFASLDLELNDFADHVGYDKGYVANVLNGFTNASPGFRRAFGETIGSLVLGTYEPETAERYPAQPLVDFVTRRAEEAPSKRDFYRDIGTSTQALKGRATFDGIFVDRICCSLGVHPSSIYGNDFGIEEAS